MTELTDGKQCPLWAQIEAIDKGLLFKNASTCGDWCCLWSDTYKTCIDRKLKELQILELLRGR